MFSYYILLGVFYLIYIMKIQSIFPVHIADKYEHLDVGGRTNSLILDRTLDR